MTGLPASIEAYLTDAGFSGTELLVLKKLLEGEAMTLRELGTKTGKSTGVLDQAVHKLLGRRIIARETVNDTPKVMIKSLDAIQRWMERDSQEKLRVMRSRAKDFESFIASLKQESKRPDIEYFEGAEGIEKAYLKLLTLGVKEFLHYRPVTVRDEDDPLRAFRVQYFRERHRLGIFTRTLAPNTPLGRRFKSRDPFEYRSTQLLEEGACPITFEKVIAGDTIACFNHGEQRACFLRYPELARTEREMFELLWRRAQEPPTQAQTAAVTLPAMQPQFLIPFDTRTLSCFRQFLLSRKSVVLFGLCAVLAAGITYGLYRHNVWLNTERIRERAIAIAATAAPEFDAGDIDQIHTAEDVKKSEFMKLVNHLRQIQTQNAGVKWVYIDRPTGLPDAAWEVVAAADYGTPDEDLNGNGVVEESEQLTIPGQKYPHGDPDLQEVLKGPTAILVTDEWGEYFDASAPIFDSQGKVVAVLYIDVSVQELHDLTNQSFTWSLYFLGFFFLFVFIRLAAFNRSLFLELLKVLRSKRFLLSVGVCSLAALGVTYGIWRHTYNLNLQRVREQVMAIAATAAPEFNAADLDQIHIWRDAEKPVYRNIVAKLQSIRARNPGLRYVYIQRLLDRATRQFEFIADADSPNPLDPSTHKDINGDGLDNDVIAPGYLFFWDTSMYKTQPPRTLTEPTSYDPYQDEWGIWISGAAPIFDGNGKYVAELGVDVDASQAVTLSKKSTKPLLIFFGFFFLFAFISLLALNHEFFLSLLKLPRSKRVLFSLCFCAAIALGMTYGLYLYTLNLMKEQVGGKLMSIASTAAPEIDARDLEPLHFARDMETEAYQRVFKKLNEIRERNKDNHIMYAYIFRPTAQPTLWEFVADADSNYDIPLLSKDHNGDGVIDEADENAWPGLLYDATGQEFVTKGLRGPMVEGFATDKWGTFLTGFAPIRDSNGSAVAILGLDMEVTSFYQQVMARFTPIFWLGGGFMLIIMIYTTFLIFSRKIN